MKDKLTIIKIGNEYILPTPQDLEDFLDCWKRIEEKDMGQKQILLSLMTCLPFSINEIDVSENSKLAWSFPIDFVPSEESFKSFNELLKDVLADPDLCVFISHPFEIEVIKNTEVKKSKFNCWS